MKAENNFSILDVRDKLYTAIREDDIKNVINILNIAKGAGPTILRDLLLSPDQLGDTVLHCIANRNYTNSNILKR